MLSQGNNIKQKTILQLLNDIYEELVKLNEKIELVEIEDDNNDVEERTNTDANDKPDKKNTKEKKTKGRNTNKGTKEEGISDKAMEDVIKNL